MGICRATKKNGEACSLPATGQHGFCWAHNPDNKEARRRVASSGGKGKAAKRVAVLWDEVRAVIEGVESERLSPPQGNTMLRGYGTLIDLAKLDIEQSELDIAKRRLELDEQERLELLSRIEALEETERLRKERSRFGA
jgi:hypothetical protein